MKRTLNNTALWNEAAKAGFFFGLISVGCLLLKELAGVSGSAFLQQAALIILWAVEFFGCILLMKRVMLDLKDKYEGVRMEHTRKMGSRAALLSGLLLASAQAIILMNMPQESMNEVVDTLSGTMQISSAQREQLSGMLDNLPVYTFLFQWLYCYLYGSILASFMSRYIFLQRLFMPQEEDRNNIPPDEQ